MVEHVGGWTHLEVWVEAPGLEDLIDAVADTVIPWCSERGLDAHVSGMLNASPPEWATTE